ncbi:MAG: hypothetical protein NDF54_02955 [archaeon GB-1867-035]|nr:hypothetical protein [Candidatus Culexmicrobium profundum]
MRKKKSKYELMKKIEKVIEELNYNVDLVIVEGTHDEKALRRYGYNKIILKFSSSRKPMYLFVDEIVSKYRGKKIAILLDYDKEGEIISKKLENQLEERGLRVEKHWRKIIKELMAKEGMMTIEELTALKRKAIY